MHKFKKNLIVQKLMLRKFVALSKPKYVISNRVLVSEIDTKEIAKCGLVLKAIHIVCVSNEMQREKIRLQT